jgi:hypothetical protein
VYASGEFSIHPVGYIDSRGDLSWPRIELPNSG